LGEGYRNVNIVSVITQSNAVQELNTLTLTLLTC